MPRRARKARPARKARTFHPIVENLEAIQLLSFSSGGGYDPGAAVPVGAGTGYYWSPNSYDPFYQYSSDGFSNRDGYDSVGGNYYGFNAGDWSEHDVSFLTLPDCRYSWKTAFRPLPRSPGLSELWGSR